MKKLRPKRIITGTVKAIKGTETESSRQRLLTCKNCPQYKNGLCGVCGCVITSKSKVFEEYCPINNWKDIKIFEKHGIALGIKNNDKTILTLDIEENSFILNYGTITKKSDTKLELVVINDRVNFTDKNINLTNVEVKPNCGCTLLSKVPDKLKDGEFFEFSLEYKVKDNVGRFNKKVFFKSDQVIFLIQLKGEVIE